MQTVKNKFKNIRNEHLKSIYKDGNFILSLKQPENLYRFIPNFKNIRKAATYKRSYKRCKIFQNNLNEINKFTMSDGQVWEIRRKIDCDSTNVIYIRNVKCITKKEPRM